MNERRDVKARSTKVMYSLARIIAELGISPNFISLLSIAFAFVAALAFMLSSNSKLFFIVAAICILMRLICNLMDGMVAVEFEKKSNIGELYNEIPDRISDTLILIGAGFAIKTVPYAMDIAYFAAISALFTSYIRTLGAGQGVRNNFRGPMAKQHRMFIMIAACLLSIIPLPFNIIYISLIVIGLGAIPTTINRLKPIVAELNSKDNG